MKVLVDKLPDQTECPYANWEPLPPCCEEIGYWVCKLFSKPCPRKFNDCLYFKELKVDTM